MKTNIPKPAAPAQRTAGGAGAIASKITHEQELSRLMATYLMWEDNAYESGVAIAHRIKQLVPLCRTEFLEEVAVRARTEMHLRHAPLSLVREMARTPAHQGVVAKLLPQIILRADELAEFLAIYWKDGKQPISAQVKKGLAASFNKFNEYQLAKYNRDGAVKLRDVAFLSHAKPWDGSPMSAVRKRRTYKKGDKIMGAAALIRHPDSTLAKLIEDRLETPDTWEVELSKGTDKLASWTRLLEERKLGGMAFIRNLRNMTEAKVPHKLLAEYAATVNTDRVLPFRFIQSAKINAGLEDILEPLMLRAAGERPKLEGRTICVIDTSGSMTARISAKSETSRMETAAALAILLREQCDDAAFYATAGSDGTRGHATMLVAPRRGFALADEFKYERTSKKIGGGGIFLKQMCDWVAEREKGADRLIVFTDEQDTDHKANAKEAHGFAAKNYIINIAAHRNGVGYGTWNHIDGWSESVLDYIAMLEKM